MSHIRRRLNRWRNYVSGGDYPGALSTSGQNSDSTERKENAKGVGIAAGRPD